jgi:hypothetical protein
MLLLPIVHLKKPFLLGKSASSFTTTTQKGGVSNSPSGEDWPQR